MTVRSPFPIFYTFSRNLSLFVTIMSWEGSGFTSASGSSRALDGLMDSLMASHTQVPSPPVVQRRKAANQVRKFSYPSHHVIDAAPPLPHRDQFTSPTVHQISPPHTAPRVYPPYPFNPTPIGRQQPLPNADLNSTGTSNSNMPTNDRIDPDQVTYDPSTRDFHGFGVDEEEPIAMANDNESDDESISTLEELHRRSDLATQSAVDMLPGKETQKKINRGRALWYDYVRVCNPGQKDELPSIPNFVNAAGLPDSQKYVGFIAHLDSQPGCKQHHIDCGIKFIQTQINNECAIRRLPQMEGCVCADPAVKIIRKIRNKSRSQRALESFVDMQDGIDDEISRDQMLDIIEYLYDPPSDCPVVIRSLLSRMQLAGCIRQTFSTGVRGELCRFEYKNFCFVRHIKGIGVHPRGETAHMMVSDKGKTNVCGKRKFKAVLTHMNPLLDTMAHKGAMLLTRYVYMSEPYPDHLNKEQHRSRPVWRAMKSYADHIGSTSMGEQYTALYDALKVHVPKKTHQGRVQFQQHCDRKDVPLCDIGRAADYSDGTSKHINRKQITSYLTNPPNRTLIAAHDGDPKFPLTFYVPWKEAVVSDSLVFMLFPHVESEMKKVAAAIDECKGNKTLMKERCLYEARGSLQSDKLLLTRFLQFAAARPLDEHNRLLTNEPPIFIKFSRCPLFHHPVFKTDEFLNLVRNVEYHQMLHHNQYLPMSGGVADKVQSMVLSSIAPFFVGMSSKCDALYSKLDQLNAMVDKLVKNSNVRPNNITSSSQCIEDGQSSTQHTDNVADGTGPRKKARLEPKNTSAFESIMSYENITLSDFWDEYYRGRNGKPSLLSLEKEGMCWRRDEPGKTVNKKAWCQRVPIYNLMHHYMDVLHMSEMCVRRRT